MKILLVDDDPNVRNAVKRSLRDEGHEIRESTNGKAALEVLANEKFDLILTDNEMPIMDGRIMINAILRAGLQKPGDIIMMSGIPRPESLNEEILFINKTHGIQEIKKIIKNKETQK